MLLVEVPAADRWVEMWKIPPWMPATLCRGPYSGEPPPMQWDEISLLRLSSAGYRRQHTRSLPRLKREEERKPSSGSPVFEGRFLFFCGKTPFDPTADSLVAKSQSGFFPDRNTPMPVVDIPVEAFYFF